MSADSASLLGRWAAPLIDPKVFDFWAGRLNATWSWARPLARVVDRRVEAQDAVTLVLKPNRHWKGFLPGQHVNVTAEVDGRRLTRSYSLTGLPGRDRRVSITVKRVEGGRLSTHLCRYVKRGDLVELGPAFGDMTLPAALQGRWLLLAAGSGITPLIGLTRALAAQGMPVDLDLVYWARTRAELCFVRELRDLAARHARFNVHFVLTREAEGTRLLADESRGRLDVARLQALAGPLAGRDVRACGPHGFVEAARAAAQHGAASFHAEAFTLPDVRDEQDDGGPATVQVHLRSSGRILQVPTGQTLLDALEAQGLRPPAGCRRGICHTCSCPKPAGAARDIVTGEVHHEPGALRLCVSRATSDLVLDL